MSVRLLSLLPLLLPSLALAQGDSPSLTAYTRAGGGLYLSAAQTAGGVGGGVGLRATWDERLFAQGDVSYLLLLGNALAVRVGAGLQRPGTWTPAVRLQAQTLLGERLRFSSGERPGFVEAPAWSVGVALAPLRFTTAQAQLSLLELEVGAGWDFPGLGWALGLTLLEAGVRF